MHQNVHSIRIKVAKINALYMNHYNTKYTNSVCSITYNTTNQYNNQYGKISHNSPVFVYAKNSLLSVKRIALICPSAMMQVRLQTVVEETLW